MFPKAIDLSDCFSYKWCYIGFMSELCYALNNRIISNMQVFFYEELEKDMPGYTKDL